MSTLLLQAMLLVDVSPVNSFVAVTHVSKAIAPVTNALLLFVISISVSIQFNSSCSMLTPKVTSGKKLSQCRERVFKQRRLRFTLENVRVCYFLNCLSYLCLSSVFIFISLSVRGPLTAEPIGQGGQPAHFLLPMGKQ